MCSSRSRRSASTLTDHSVCMSRRPLCSLVLSWTFGPRLRLSVFLGGQPAQDSSEHIQSLLNAWKGADLSSPSARAECNHSMRLLGMVVTGRVQVPIAKLYALRKATVSSSAILFTPLLYGGIIRFHSPEWLIGACMSRRPRCSRAHSDASSTGHIRANSVAVTWAQKSSLITWKINALRSVPEADE